MDKRGCKNFGAFGHARGFISEIILPPQGRNIDIPFYDSWSDSCLGPGLRRVLHRLCDRRTTRGCDPRHDYFTDILYTARDLDNEFSKLEHFLSIRKNTSTIRDGKIPTISVNDMNYLDFAAKSLMNLIFSLKRDLIVQRNIGCGYSFETVFETKQLVKGLENKLYGLLKKLEEFKIDSDRNFCCKRCSKHITTTVRPLQSRTNCPWKNNVGNSDQDRCVRKMCLNYPRGEVPLQLNRSRNAYKKEFKHGNARATQSKFIAVKNTLNDHFHSNINSKLTFDTGHSVKSGFTRSKTGKDLQNQNMGVYGHLKDCKFKKRYPNSTKSEQLNICCSIKNKNVKPCNNLGRFETNNMVHGSSKTAAHSQNNTTSKRKRAGKDGSGIYELSNQKQDSFHINRRFHNAPSFNRKNKQQNGHNKISQPSNQHKMWSKRVSFYSTSSDKTCTTCDDISHSSIFTISDFKHSDSSKQNINRARKERLNKIGANYSYTNRKQRSEEDQNTLNNNKAIISRSANSFSSEESLSNEQDYVTLDSSSKIKSSSTSSRKPRNNKRFSKINKPYEPLKKPTNNNPKSQMRGKQWNANEINRFQPKHSDVRVYPSKQRSSNQKQRARTKKSKIGEFLKRVRNSLSKIRLFSNEPTQNISESGQSKGNVRYTSETYRKGYKIVPKRQEYANSDYPSRNRIRPHTRRQQADSVDGNVYSSSRSPTQLTFSDDHSISGPDETNNVSRDYPYFFERIPSSLDHVSGCSIVSGAEYQPCPPDVPNSPQTCNVCPPKPRPDVSNLPDEDCELADEYEIIFEKVNPEIKYDRPKKVIIKKPIEESSSTLSTESIASSESVSSSSLEHRIIHKPRRRVRIHRFRSSTVVEKRVSPVEEEVRRPKYTRRRKYIRVGSRKLQRSTERQRKYYTVSSQKLHKSTRRRLKYFMEGSVPPSEEEEVVHRSKHRRRRKYIRVGLQKFQESPEKVVDYDSGQPFEKTNSPRPTVKNTFSRGTSTENFQPDENRFFSPSPVKDIYSRGTSTEILPMYAKRTSTSDLIKLIKVIGTNTDRLITRETGIDPIPLQQKTPRVVIDVKSKFTNTDKINVQSTGTYTTPEKAKPPVVNKATDPLFYSDQQDKTTNTTPEKKKQLTNVGTDPKPTKNLQLSNRATDPLHYLGQQVKFTNTETVIKIHAQTETPKAPANISIATTTTPVRVQDQKTIYEKVKTSSRGNNPIEVKMSDKGLQFDTVEHKPAVKMAFTETFTQPLLGKTTQTSFKEKPKITPLVYHIQTQTEEVKQKPPPPILKQRRPSISEEIAVVEAEESSTTSPSELSMHLVFEKCKEEIYKKRPNVRKPRCFDNCDRSQKFVVCDSVRSNRAMTSSLSDCNVSSISQRGKSPHSDLELAFRKTNEPLKSNFISEDGVQPFHNQSSGRTRKPKLGPECGIIGQKHQVNKHSPKPVDKNNIDYDEKSKSTINPTVFESSYTTLNSCDWKNIAEEVKLNKN